MRYVTLFALVCVGAAMAQSNGSVPGGTATVGDIITGMGREKGEAAQAQQPRQVKVKDRSVTSADMQELVAEIRELRAQVAALQLKLSELSAGVAEANLRLIEASRPK